MGSLQILHARNDMDISCAQTGMIVERIFGETGHRIDVSEGEAMLDVKEDGKLRFRVEIGEYGGKLLDQDAHGGDGTDC